MIEVKPLTGVVSKDSLDDMQSCLTKCLEDFRKDILFETATEARLDMIRSKADQFMQAISKYGFTNYLKADWSYTPEEWEVHDRLTMALKTISGYVNECEKLVFPEFYDRKQQHGRWLLHNFDNTY